MHRILIVALATVFALTTAAPAIAHGGGCRKSSPKGQCCHLETRTGKVHCHTKPTN